MDKKKVFHILIHILILGIFITPSITSYQLHLMEGNTVFNFSITNLIIIAIYLINILWLIPKYILRRSYLSYMFLILGLLCFFIVAQHSVKFYFPNSKPPFERARIPTSSTEPNASIFLPRSQWPKKNWFPIQPMFIFPFFFRYFMIMGLGTLVELIILFEKERRKNDQMEKQKALSELNILKNQLNPHFLFNALNNIYSLARKKSTNTTPAILLLSDMLRYVLYESEKNKITLQQEVDFIQNYINLEKLKFSESNTPNITLKIAIQTKEYLIEPMLLITLLENAFKHGVSFISKSFILVSLVENEKEILFSVINSKVSKDGFEINHHARGLGIYNLQKRMELLYPGKYSFRQQNELDTFKSYLTIRK